MAYEPTEWKAGDVITGPKMNKIEAQLATNTEEIESVIPQENLFALTKSVEGYINTDGGVSAPGAQAQERVSEYIAVTPGDAMAYQCWVNVPAGSIPWAAYCFYDSDRAKTGSVVAVTDATSTASDGSKYIAQAFTVPSGAAYIRVSFRTFGAARAKLEVGSTPTPYVVNKEDYLVQIAAFRLYNGAENSTVVVPETTVSFTRDRTNNWYVSAANPISFAPQIGHQYEVTWDGTSYRCWGCVFFMHTVIFNAWDVATQAPTNRTGWNCYSIGDISTFGQTNDPYDDADIPFAIITNFYQKDSNDVHVFTTDSAAAHTIQIKDVTRAANTLPKPNSPLQMSRAFGFPLMREGGEGGISLQQGLANGHCTYAANAGLVRDNSGYSFAVNHGIVNAPNSFAANSSKALSHVSAAFGGDSEARGYYSFAEGYMTVAGGDASHAEGIRSTATGQASHAAGGQTIANHQSQFVVGEYNAADPSAAAANERGDYAFIVGNGTSDAERSNAFAVKWDGTLEIGGVAVTPAQFRALQQINDTRAGKLVDTATGTSVAVVTDAYINAPLISVAEAGATSQDGTPTPSSPVAIEGLAGYDTMTVENGVYTYSRSAAFDASADQYYAVQVEDGNGHTTWIGTTEKIAPLYAGDSIDFATGVVTRKNLLMAFSNDNIRSTGSSSAGLRYFSAATPGGIALAQTTETTTYPKCDRAVSSTTASVAYSIRATQDGATVYYVYGTADDTDATLREKFAGAKILLRRKNLVSETVPMSSDLSGIYGYLTLTGSGTLTVRYAADLKTYIDNAIANALNA